MARNNQPTPCALRSILEKEKLSGTNYSDWIRNLRIVLRAKKKESVLDTPIPDEPLDTDTAAIRATYKRAIQLSEIVEGIISTRLSTFDTRS